MRRLQVRLVSFAAITAIFGCGASDSKDYMDGMYYLNGMNSGDGMSARISFEDDTIRVAGQVFGLNSCEDGAPPSRQCIKSEYFVFGYKSSLLRHWLFDGFVFDLSRNCLFADGGVHVWTFGVDSYQRYGKFTFFIKPDGDLVGWKLTHEEGEDFFLTQGLSPKKCYEL